MTESKGAIVFAVLLLLGNAGGADAARLRITDKTNAVVVIDAAFVHQFYLAACREKGVSDPPVILGAQ